MQSNISFTFRIAPALLEWVRAEAQRNRRTVGAELMVLVEDGFAFRQRPITKVITGGMGATGLPA